MKKTIIPLFCCTAMQSFLSVGATLNVYGVAHLSADNVDDGQNSSAYVTSSSSRLGFSGDYQLNNNLTAIFQYETGVDLTAQGGNDGNGGASSSGQIFTKGRPSFVGLKGNLGKVLIGHMPALDQWANDYNLFADQVGDLGNLWEGSGVPGRLDNVIYYSTPQFNGLDIAVTYKPEEGDNGSDHFIVKGNYDIENVKVGVSFASIGQGEMSNDDHTVSALTLSYIYNDFSVGGGFQSESDIRGMSGDDRTSFSIGASKSIGTKGKVKIQFANSEGDMNNSDANLFALGYDYQLSKDITLYAAYSKMKNDDNVNFSANGKGHGDKVIPNIGQDPHALSLGIVYKFDVNLSK